MTPIEERVTAMLYRLADFAQLDAAETAPGGADEPQAGGKRRRSYALATAALAVFVIAGSLIVLGSRHGHRSRAVSTSGGGTVSVLPAAPIAARADAAGVWTGTELLIWGGAGSSGAFDDGSSYDPRLGRWAVMAAAPISARADAAAVWTGSELVVWGGYANGSVRSDGAAYNPATRRWRMIAPSPMAGLVRPATIWTGAEMIVVGGINGGERGGAYNPAANTWRSIAAPPGTTPVPYPQGVWTGTTALFVLDVAPATPAPPTPTSSPNTPQSPYVTPPLPAALPTPGPPDSNLTLAAYDPGSNSWTKLGGETIGQGSYPWLVWTGSEALILGPFAHGRNVAYKPSTHAWRVLSAPAPSALGAASAGDTYPVWSGRQVLFWHGGPAGVAYDPISDTWQHFDAGNLAARTDGIVAWSGDTLLGWGGGSPGASTYHADGVSIRPA